MLDSGVPLSRRGCWDVTAPLPLFRVVICRTLEKLLLKFAKSASDRMSFQSKKNRLQSVLFSDNPAAETLDHSSTTLASLASTSIARVNAKFSERCRAGYRKQ